MRNIERNRSKYEVKMHCIALLPNVKGFLAVRAPPQCRARVSRRLAQTAPTEGDEARAQSFPLAANDVTKASIMYLLWRPHPRLLLNPCIVLESWPHLSC